MGVAKTKVFLVQGQRTNMGREGLIGEIEQIVVVAENRDEVSKLLASNAPDFRLVGSTTLNDYEATAARIRAVLSGASTEWSVLVAHGMVMDPN